MSMFHLLLYNLPYITKTSLPGHVGLLVKLNCFKLDTETCLVYIITKMWVCTIASGMHNRPWAPSLQQTIVHFFLLMGVMTLLLRKEWDTLLIKTFSPMQCKIQNIAPKGSCHVVSSSQIQNCARTYSCFLWILYSCPEVKHDWLSK